MIDDGMPDTMSRMVPLPQTDQALIGELKRRGFKVYPDKRVRIYGAETMINYSELGRAVTIGRRNDVLAHTHRRMAMDVGIAIFEAKAIVSSSQDNDFGKVFRAQVCVVLPNDWDFEAEMWGMR
jgi:hypothetical protein